MPSPNRLTVPTKRRRDDSVDENVGPQSEPEGPKPKKRRYISQFIASLREPLSIFYTQAGQQRPPSDTANIAWLKEEQALGYIKLKANAKLSWAIMCMGCGQQQGGTKVDLDPYEKYTIEIDSWVSHRAECAGVMAIWEDRGAVEETDPFTLSLQPPPVASKKRRVSTKAYLSWLENEYVDVWTGRQENGKMMYGIGCLGCRRQYGGSKPKITSEIEVGTWCRHREKCPALRDWWLLREEKEKSKEEEKMRSHRTAAEKEKAAVAAIEVHKNGIGKLLFKRTNGELTVSQVE